MDLSIFVVSNSNDMTKSASFWGGIAVCLLVFTLFTLTTTRSHEGADHGSGHDMEHHEGTQHAEGHGEHGGH